MTDSIRLLLNGQHLCVEGVAPTTMLLAWLRQQQGLKGSKEGCGEGDCGACTVVVGSLVEPAQTLQLRTINACIQLLPALDGKAVFTVEYLQQLAGEHAQGQDAPPARQTIRLHPVQQAMVEHHGSQCGFCTPGFVMSLWQLYESCAASGQRPDQGQVASALTGNLCRCTGYRPIIDAGLAMCEGPKVLLDREAVRQQLLALQRTESLDYVAGGVHFHAPRSARELAALRAAKPAATLLAGCTDVGLWINKQFRDVGDLIYTPAVQELRRCETAEDGSLWIGAGVALSDAYAALVQHYPELTELWERFASTPVRNAGTLGGNIANGSPIGDSAPPLIALGAQVLLASQRGTRALPLEGFYLDYMKKDLARDEFVLAVQVPPRPAGAGQFVLRTYKVSKRFDSDISAVCAAFALWLEAPAQPGAAPTVAAARIAFGGMAATSRRAAGAEAALTGRPWAPSSVLAAQQALRQDFSPLSDMRAARSYRERVAANLLQRCWLETRHDAPLSPEATRAYPQLALFEALQPALGMEVRS
ncbi:FAD-binding molybdopterin dehydrogenase [Lampropedia cohaerens]|uniref:FAD-binding molybdopterin dehydrogenase n=1 Tax=Lampropedia cohaerens TaxID=1610491 RepID=A0A0U1PYA7_9BURK|nr:xanthine dehydrogenase small subunit [Lampropedia cohaerens]KKW67508.1 FAD-binding molybdopterin dehydrogenase [Lampropedia cohaerens]